MRIEDHIGQALLDDTLTTLDAGEYRTALDGLYEGLLAVRRALPSQDWREFVQRAVRHPLRERIHQDPMTRRSFEKPRGYAGDAVLLDYIYGLRTPESDDPVARAVYAHAASRPAARSVRRRRERIAGLIDSVAERRGAPIRVLSIAAGHMREGEISNAFSEGAVETFVALDSDAESCEEIRRSFPQAEVRHGSFTSLFRERAFAGHFDLVYSAGLFDYLDERVASRLTARMFEMLRPGGTLFLTNFLPTTEDAGYMESYMGWELIFRSEQELAALTRVIAGTEVAGRRVFADEDATIGYLEVDRG